MKSMRNQDVSSDNLKQRYSVFHPFHMLCTFYSFLSVGDFDLGSMGDFSVSLVIHFKRSLNSS